MKQGYLLITTIFMMCTFLPYAGFADEFLDDFDDDDISDWEWINKTDESGVEDGEAYMNSATIPQKLILLSPISVKNFTATYDMKVINAPAGGLIFRYQDIDNYYFVHQGTAKLRLRRGAEPDILGVDKSQVANQYVTYKVVVKDDHITVYMDGEEILDANDSSIPQKGRIGFIVNSNADLTLHHTYFDNFTVESEEFLMAVDIMGKLASTWGQLKALQ